MKTSCAACGGTGSILSHRSWFVSDGFYSTRCGICAGSGVSSYRDVPSYVRFQSAARRLVAEWRGMKPEPHQIANARKVLDAAAGRQHA